MVCRASQYMVYVFVKISDVVQVKSQVSINAKNFSKFFLEIEVACIQSRATT